MKGKWKMMQQYAGGECLIRVVRLRDVNEVRHVGNLEFYPSIFATKEEAEAKAAELNNEEGIQDESSALV